MHFEINYRWDLLHISLCPPTAEISFTIYLYYVHLPLGIASTEVSPTCPPTTGNCFNRSISYMSTYRREFGIVQQKHPLHVHLPLGIASTEASPICPPTAGNSELLQQKHPLHVHLRQGIASTEASPTCPPTAWNCLNKSISYMSTYRWELLHQLPTVCPPTAGNCFTTSICCVHLPLGMTEGSVLKSRSRHRAADCFYYMSTYRWKLLHNMSTYRWEWRRDPFWRGVADTGQPTASPRQGCRRRPAASGSRSRTPPPCPARGRALGSTLIILQEFLPHKIILFWIFVLLSVFQSFKINTTLLITVVRAKNLLCFTELYWYLSHHYAVRFSSDNIITSFCRSGSGIRCLFDPWIRDPGWVKNQDPIPGWISRIIFPKV